ncbi:MAG TPA: hypothetical protein VNI01_04070 [Elusimicrobiota bacterium]|jgi:hypothetical protein|nr:hypothetical protein [Elusimicrobiota bacterium]
MKGLALALIAFLPRTSSACAVCFGQGDNPDLPRAFTWGIFVLIGVTFLVLGTFVASVIRVEASRADDVE